jgi:hypothetical protein
MPLKNNTIFLILILGLILRIMWLLFVPGNFIESSDDYDKIAQNIIAGHGFRIFEDKPTAERMPIYPLFLVLIYKIFGRNIPLVCYIQACIDMLTCFVFYKVVLMIFESSRVALIAALIFALYMPYYSIVGVIMNEILFNLVFWIFVYFFFKNFRNLTQKNSFFLGLLLAVSSLIRETPFLLIIPLILTPLIMKKFHKSSFKLASFIALGFLLLYIPWFVRSTIAFKKIVILSTHSGFNLYTNYKIPEAKKGEPDAVIDLDTYSKLSQKTEVDMDKELMKRAISIMIEKPLHTLQIFCMNFFDFWLNLTFFLEQRVIKYYPVGPKVFAFSYTIIFFNVLILSTALFGLYSLKTKWKIDYTIMMIFVGYFNLLQMVFMTVVRHSMPVIPFMMMFSSYYTLSLIDRKKPFPGKLFKLLDFKA